MDSSRFRFRKILVWVGETRQHPHGSQHPPFWKLYTVDPTSPWFTRSCMKSHEWTFAKLGTTAHDNIFEVLIAGSLSSLYSWLPTALFYLHRGTSHIGSCWHVFSGRAALGLSFRERKPRNDQICPFSSEDNVLLTRGSRLYPDYIPPLLTKYGVYTADKYFSRNK